MKSEALRVNMNWEQVCSDSSLKNFDANELLQKIDEAQIQKQALQMIISSSSRLKSGYIGD